MGRSAGSPLPDDSRIGLSPIPRLFGTAAKNLGTPPVRGRSPFV